MILANVDVGTGPSAGDGDPLRSAFITINDNFAKLQSNVNSLTNSVSSVAGRTGNVTLTVQDIIGFNTLTYPNASVVGSWISSNVSALIAGAPGALDTLNELANALGNNSSFSSTIANSLASLTANDAVQAGDISTLYANAAIQAANISALFSNAAVQAGQIASVEANVGIANLAMKGYVDSQVTSLTGNAATQAGQISALQDISGTSWRSVLESTITSKPSWLSYYPAGHKTSLGTQYGFDGSGMFFAGNADNAEAYPIRTNIHFNQADRVEIIATINFAHQSNDPGIAIFNVGSVPIWKYAIDTSRIAFQYSFGAPRLYGRTTEDISGTPVLTAPNVYTIRFVYDPEAGVTVETYSGSNINGALLDTRTVSETLPEGDFVIGFDADQDQVGLRSYYTNLILNTATKTITKDLQVLGTATVGNVVPSADVTYSLGNVTHQWKDLWVSDSTIYINSTPLTLNENNTLLVNNVPVVTYTDGNLVVGGNIITGIPTLANVATSGSYNDLIDTPMVYGNADVAAYLSTYSGNVANVIIGPNGSITFNDNTIQYTAWTGAVTYANISGAPALANVATSGNYSDLSNIPEAYGNAQVGAYLSQYTGTVGGDVVIGGNLTVTGNINLTGNVTSFDTNNLTINDSIIELHYANDGVLVGDDGRDVGIRFHYYKTTNNNAFLGWANDSGYLEWYGSDVTESNAATITGTYGTIKTGNLWLLGSANVAKINTDGYYWANGVPISFYSNLQLSQYLTTNSIGPYGNTNVATYLASVGISSYSNTNVSSYLTANQIGPYSNVNVTAYLSGAGIGPYSNTNVAAYLTTYTGNLSAGNVTFYGMPNTGVYAVDVGIASPWFSNAIANFTANVNNYTQLTLQNLSSGSGATSDYVATANNGSDSTFFVDLGIANGNYDVNSPNNSLGTAIYANDAYLYAQGDTATTVGGNLVIGAATSSRAVKIFAGGINSSNVVLTATNTGVAIAGNLTANVGGFAIGYRDIPQVSWNANATINTSDAGKHYYTTSSGNLTLTVANNATQSFSIGATINIINQGTGTMTVAPAGGVTLYLAGNSTSSSRTISSYGLATITKVATDTWFIVGAGVS